MQSRPDPVDKVDGFFFSQDRVLRLSPVRIAYVLTFVILFVLTEFGRKVYRPFIYANSINDFGFADVVGNLLGTSVSIFFNLSFSLIFSQIPELFVGLRGAVVAGPDLYRHWYRMTEH